MVGQFHGVTTDAVLRAMKARMRPPPKLVIAVRAFLADNDINLDHGGSALHSAWSSVHALIILK